MATKAKVKKKPKTKAIWRSGTYLKKRPPADKALKELNRIKADNAGRLVPSVVVDEARDESCVLHCCFEWDDSAAAEAHRLQQARELMNSIKIIRDNDTDSPREEVAFINVRDEVGRSYQASDKVMSDPELREQALTEALNAIEALKRRYNHLEELAEVWQAAKKLRRRAG